MTVVRVLFPFPLRTTWPRRFTELRWYFPLFFFLHGVLSKVGPHNCLLCTDVFSMREFGWLFIVEQDIRRC